jgi:translocation and assembly module TamB
MALSRKVLRRGLWVIGAIVAIPLVLLLITLAALDSGVGQRWLVSEMTDVLSETGGGEVRVEGMSGSLFSRFAIEHISIADADGVWLEARDLAIRWHPAALLGAELHVEALQVRQITVERVPAGSQSGSQESEPFALKPPDLPLQVQVDRMAVGDLVLREPVVGEAAHLTISSQIALGGESPSINLDLQRTDQRSTSARLDARFLPAPDELALDLEVQDQPGGLIGRTLGLTEQAPLSVTLSGQAPVSDWRGTLSVDYGKVASARVAVETTRDDGGIVVTIAGPMSAPGLVPAELRPLGENVRVDVEIAAGGGQTVTIRHARLESSKVSVGASGTIDQDTMAMNLEISLDVAEGHPLAELVAPLSFRSLALKAHVEGTAASPMITADAQAGQLGTDVVALGDVSLHLQAAPEPEAGERWSVALTGKTETFDTGDPDLLGVVEGGLTIALKALVPTDQGTVELSSLEIRGRALSLTASGTVGLDDGRVQVTADGTMPDASALAGLLDLPTSGTITLHASASRKDETALLAVEATMNADNFVLGVEEADALLGGKAEIQAFASDRGGALHLDSVQLRGKSMTLTARPQVTTAFQTLPADVEGQADLAPVGPEIGIGLGGTATVTGTMGGTLGNPDLNLKVTAPKLQVAGLGPLDAAVDVAALGVGTGAHGHMAARLRGPFGPTTVSAQYALENYKRAKVADFVAESQGTRLTGTATVPFHNVVVAADLKVSASSLSPWSSVAGTDLAGSLDGRIQLTSAGGMQGVDADLTFKPLAAGGLSFDRLRATLKGSLAELRVALDGEHAGAPGGSLKAEAVARLAEDPLTVTLRSLTATSGEHKLALRRPAAVSLPAEGITIEGLALDADGGAVELSAKVGSQKLSASATLDKVPLSVVQAFTGEPAPQGDISGRVQVSGTMASPEGTANLTLNDVAMPAASGAFGKPVDGRIQARWRGGRLSLDAKLEGFAAADLAANLDVPLVMQGGAPTVPPGQPIRGTVKGGGDAALLWELVPAPEHVVQGKLTVDLAIGGTLSAPKLSGGLELTQGYYENLVLGTVVKHLELKTDLSSSREVRFTLKGTDGGSGSVGIDGTITLDQARSFPLDITAKLKKAKVLRRDDVTAALTGQADVSGSLNALTVKGRFETKGVEIRLLDQFPPQVVELDVKEVNLPAGEETESRKEAAAKRQEAASQGGITITLDIVVEMPNQVYVRGLGVDSEWKGKLEVSGTASSPKIEGSLTSLKGTVSFLGTTFQLQESTIQFTGGETINPVLNLTAARETADLVATVHITGTPNDPEVEISSVPPLPQDEVLSRVLFGKAAGNLSLLEAAQLAQVAANLASGNYGGGGGGVLDRVRTALGLDVLQVESGEGGIDAGSATIGKYLTEDVLVNVEQGIKPGSGAVSVELKVTPDISVKSKLSESGTSKLGVYWSLDY